ncbi:hypothetical protein DLM77_11645 [Leptospira yasudae]|uniref:Uncharacterized protein n=2 Tax=Leptospira yasudae TaxID=2202201 RepID=A0ABX9M2V3_9LEPT|nr:hypothetical protein DLM77_11645 [Leptospira yasudae]
MLLISNITAFVRNFPERVFKNLTQYSQRSSKREILLQIAFLIIVTSLILTDLKKIRKSLKISLQNLNMLSYTSLEQIKEAAYSHIGYKYIREIVKTIPEKEIFPITRYQDYTKNAHLYLPEYRHNIDNRLLIGINLKENDTKESVISAAVYRDEPLLNRKVWAFQTTDDYDTMTGIIFYFEESSKGTNNSIRLNLASDAQRANVIDSWNIRFNTSDPKYRFQLTRPIPNFSFSRGATDFILLIEGDEPKRIKKIEILGIKVDLNNYKIIHRSDNNFLAVQKPFLKVVYEQNKAEWKNFIEAIKNVD